MPNKIHFDIQKINNKIERRIDDKVQAFLDQRVIADSNYYVPEDTGTLKESAITSSKIGEGKLKWNTPYAREQYYSDGYKSKDKNPNARGKWFEYAKKVNLKKWLRFAQGKYDN